MSLMPIQSEPGANCTGPKWATVPFSSSSEAVMITASFRWSSEAMVVSILCFCVSWNYYEARALPNIVSCRSWTQLPEMDIIDH